MYTVLVMKILSLNTWGGRAGQEELLVFFKKQAEERVDIFCLQEMWRAPYKHLEGISAGGLAISHDDVMTDGVQKIQEALPDFRCYFRPHHLDDYGLAMYVRKDIEVIEEGEVFVYKTRDFIPVGDVGGHARNIQYITIQSEQRKLTVINFHGLWNGKGKTDSEDRLVQSDKIVTFLRNLTNPFVLMGDFNLLPDTESIKRIEETPAKNLIREYGVISTRTSLYSKPEKFADYCIISKELEVGDFKVLPDEVSDHAALLLELR